MYHMIQYHGTSLYITIYWYDIRISFTTISCILWYHDTKLPCFILYDIELYFEINIVLWYNMKLYMQDNRKLHHMIWSVIAFSSVVYLILFLVQIIIWNSDFHYFHKESSFAVLHYCFIWKISCKLFVNLSSSSLIKTTPLLLTLVRVPEKEKEMVFIRLVILLSCIKCNAL